MIRLNCFIKVSPARRAEALLAAIDLTEASRNDEGCVAYDIFESATIPEHLMICETWRDEESLRRHSETEHFTRYVGLLRSISEMHLEKMNLEK